MIRPETAPFSPEAAPFSKVRSTRAHEHIVVQLQQRILSGELVPGSHLPSERAMMLEFQVSRPTVREALRVAENMGLVSVRPGDPGGAKVLCNPSLGITHIFDSLIQAGCVSPLELLGMRIVLDSSAAALACTQPGRALSKLLDILRQMEVTTDLGAFAELDASFHEAVIVASGNRLFLLVFQALKEPIHSLIESRLRSSQHRRRKQTLQHHAAIVDAIQRGDAQRAASAVRTHLSEFYFSGLSAQDKLRMTAYVQAMELSATVSPLAL
jgi:DNA-binding FadR family transcriptional regulator